MNLRQRRQFPNWSLALEFLKRSPLNMLASDKAPPEEVPEVLKRRIVLWGTPGNSDYMSVPAGVEEEHLKQICRAILQEAKPRKLKFASVRSSNFMSFLNDFTQILNGKFKLKEVAQTITDKTSTLFEAEGASILMPANANKDMLRFAVVTAESEEIAKELLNQFVPLNLGISGWVHEHRRSLLINEKNQVVAFNPEIDKKTHFKTREVMAAPILMGEEVIGILQVVSRRNGAFKQSDLQILDLVAGIIASFIDKAKLYENRLALAQVNRELEIARELQLAMMPRLPAVIGPFKLTGESRQISTVGGDFWEVLKLNQTESLLLLGDVSGHGLSAAMVMSAVRTATRALLPQIDSAAALIEPLNKLLHNEFGIKGHYATLLFIHLNLVKRTVSYLRAGHEHPVLRNGDGYQTLKQAGGWPLGLFSYRQSDVWHTCPLAPGDYLYLYTDGVLDGLSEEEPTMEDILRDNPKIDAALDELAGFFTYMADHMGWQEQDDATVLKLTLTQSPADQPALDASS